MIIVHASCVWGDNVPVQLADQKITTASILCYTAFARMPTWFSLGDSALPFAQNMNIEVSRMLTEGAATLVLLAGAVVVYRSFRERYLGIWISGWLLYFAYHEAGVASEFLNPGGLLTTLSQLSFLLSLTLLVLAILVYTDSRRYVSILSALAIVGGGCIFLRSAWLPNSTVLMLLFHIVYRIIAVLGAIRLALFSRGRHEIGPWLMAVMLVFVHYDESLRTIHAMIGVDQLIEILLGLSMLVMVLDDLRAGKRRLEAVNAITTLIAESRDSGSMMREALEQLKDLMDAKVAWVRLLRGDNLVIQQHIGLTSELDPPKTEIPFEGSFCEKISAYRGPVIANAASVSTNLRREMEQCDLDHVVVLPLKGSSSFLGVLTLGIATPRRYLLEEKRFLTTTSNQLGLALENLQLFEQIIESHRRWISTFDSIDDLILIHDSQQRVLRANRALARKLGRSLPEIIGLTCHEILPYAQEGCPYCLPDARRIIDGKDPCFGDFSTVSTSSYEDESGHENGTIIHIISDTTEAHVAEERFRLLFEKMQEGVFISSPDGTLLDCNDAFVRMLGYSDKLEVLSFDLNQHLYPLLGRRTAYRYAMERDGFVRNYEFMVRRKDDSFITVQENSFATRDSNGQIQQYQGFLVDITEKKQAEQELRRRNRELHALNQMGMVATETFDLENVLSVTVREAIDLFSASAGSIFLFNPGTTILRRYASLGLRNTPQDSQTYEVPAQVWAELLSRKTEILTEQNIDVFPNKIREAIEKEGLRRVLAVVMWNSQRNPLGALVVSRRDDREFTDSDQQLIVTIGRQLAISIERVSLYSETSRAYEDLRNTQEQLLQSEKMSALGRMISGVAHELNNPLTAILGYAQLLEMELLSDRAKDFVSKLYKQTLRTQRIVQNLLSFSRQRKPQKGEIDLAQVVEEILVLRESDLKLNNIVVEKSFQPVPPVIADAHQLEQVFLNIINNAVDAILERSRGGELEVSILEDSGFACVLFHDSGPGVTELSRIFDPFFTTKKLGKGTGLGLSICYGILKEHGGEILASNHEEGGALFEVRLPLARKPAPKSSEKKNDTEQQTFCGRVLLVETEESILEFEREVLSAAGARVECLTSGEAAIAQLQHNTYDVIVIDSNMPGGWQAEDIHQWLHDNRPGVEKRMIATVSDQVNPDSLRFFQENGIAYLAKPFDISDLVGMVKQVAS